MFELTIEQWEFLGQAFLLGVGAIVTIKLVPHFTNKYHEKQKILELEKESREKQMDIEREKRQKEIDRKREDRKQQLAIQHELLLKTTEIFVNASYFYVNYDFDILGKPLEIRPDDLKNFQTQTLAHSKILELYYENTPIFIEWAKQRDIAHIFMRILSVSRENVNSEHVRTVLERYMQMRSKPLQIDVDKTVSTFEKDGLVKMVETLGYGSNKLLNLIKDNPPQIVFLNEE